MNAVLTLAILGAMIFVAVKVVPAVFANYQIQDAIETEARFAITNRKSPEEIREDVWKKTQELGIPVKRDDIRVTGSQSTIDISFNYAVPIDLQVYQFILNFHPHADNRKI